MMLLAGMMLDDLGARIVLLIGSLGTAAGLYCAGLSKSLAQTAGSILVVGAGSAFLSVGSVVLMETAFYPEHIAASQNLGNVFFGLGALLTPPLLETLLERVSYRRALYRSCVRRPGSWRDGDFDCKRCFPHPQWRGAHCANSSTPKWSC